MTQRKNQRRNKKKNMQMDPPSQWWTSKKKELKGNDDDDSDAEFEVINPPYVAKVLACRIDPEGPTPHRHTILEMESPKGDGTALRYEPRSFQS